MKLAPLIVLFLLALRPLTQAQVAAPPPPQSTMEWLRGLLTEGRVGLEASPAVTPRLFTEKMADGRSWIHLAEDTLAAAAGGDPAAPQNPAQWALLDEASSLLLEESERMRDLAARRTGADQATVAAARREYLASCARFLKAYSTAAGVVLQTHAGSIPQPSAQTDWQLPAEIELLDVTGSGRINRRTGEFSGRVRGFMAMPQLSTFLEVPGLSFDSRGNFDLTAHGSAALPPGDPRGIQLTIPSRRPLSIHLAEDGDFSVSGGVLMDLPNGIRLDGFFDIDDPRYELGLGFSGGVTFNLARQISLVRPVVNFTAAAPLTVEALNGFGQFFGSLASGLENFLTNRPELPDPASFDVGRAPEFETPETVIPFDIVDAWLVAISNDVVAPAVNGTLNATLEPARAVIGSLQKEVAAVRTDLAPTLPQIRQLARIVELNAAARRASATAAAQSRLGEDGAGLTSQLTANAVAAAGRAKEWLRDLDAATDLKTGLAILTVYVDAAAKAQEAGSNEHFDPALVGTKIVDFRNRVLSSFGFAPNGSPADQARVAALNPMDLRLLISSLLEMDALQQRMSTSDDNELAVTMSRRQFDLLRNRYTAALERADIEEEAVMAVHLLHLAGDYGLVTFPATDAEVAFMADAWRSTHDAIVARAGSQVSGAKLAAGILEAASRVVTTEQEAVLRRKVESFGQEPKKKETAGLGAAERSFLEQVSRARAVLEGRRLFTAAMLAGYRSSLSSWLDNSRAAIARDFPDTASVERNVEGAATTLQSLTDMLVFLDDLVPEDVQLIGRMQATWQAHHVKWTGVAEARKAHWYLAAYARELTAAMARYGDGTGLALTNALRVAGTEAMGGLKRVTDAMVALLDTVSLEEFTFPLPGDLRIDAAHGRLVFNRITGAWEVGFGSTLRFPDTEFSLDVREATLAKNGDYSLNLGTTGAVPLGGSSKISYTVADFSAAGNTAQQIQFSGNGTLTYDGSNLPGDEFSVGLGLAFDSTTGVVDLNANLNNSPLVFAEDFVLLNGAAGLTFGTQSPAGALRVSGKLGLLARQKPLPAAGLAADDFWLTIDALPTTFTFTDEDVKAEFTGGTITLPPDLFSSTAQPGSPPVTLSLTGRLCVRYVFATRALEFCSDPGAPYTLALANLKLSLAELPGFELGISTATLELSGTQFPLLKNLNASVSVPMPGADATDAQQNTSATFNITAQNWRIDGLPEAASIGIGQNLRLADFGGFQIDLLSGSAFSLTSAAGTPRRLTMGFTGGMRAGFDQRALSNDGTGEAVLLTGNGTLRWDMQSLPVLQDLALALEGNFRLGESGPRITGLEDGQLARVAVQNVQNLFNQSAQPVIISLEGALDIPDLIKVGLVNSRFILRGNGLEMEPGGIAFELRGQTLEAAKDVLPVYLSEFRLTFQNQHPIVPAAGQPGLFDVDNLIFTFSGGVNLPNGASIEAGSPGFSGTVQDLEMRLNRQPDGALLPVFNVDAITVQLQNLDIPPLGNIQGGLGVLNLSALSLDPPHPERVTFVGELGCDFNGVGAGVLLAASPFELHGLCIRASGGPAGIPLDGGVLGGVLWTGAEGGIHFKDSFSNPCEFESYFLPDSENPTSAAEFPPEGDPALEANAMEDPLVEVEKENPSDLYAKPDNLPKTDGVFDPFDCLKDNWPPRAANPLCEEFPAGSGRRVFLGTRLSTVQADALLDGIGLTANDTRSADQLATDIIGQLLNGVVTQSQQAVSALLSASGQQGNAKLVAHFNDLTQRLIDSFDDAARPVLLGILEPAIGGGGSVRTQLRDALTQGIPCFNVTFLGSGTFTHAAVSAVMDLKGTVSMSTSGAALARGELRLVGLPVAEASLGVSLTNQEGKISPFMGGLARVGLGPVQLGKMTMSAAMPDASAILTHFGDFLNCVGTVMTTGAQNQLRLLMEGITRTPMPAGVTVQQFLQSGSEADRLALMAGLFNYFALAAEDRLHAGQPGYVPKLPPALQLALADFNSLLGCFETFVAATLNSLTPELCFGGKIQPEIFNIPMTASGQPFASARMRFGPALRIPAAGESSLDLLGNPAANLRPGAPPALREFSAYMQFSPTATLLAPLSGVAVALNPANAPFVGFTAIDSAEFGMSFQVEEWTQAKVHDFLFDPLKFYGDRTREFFETAVFSAGYSMNPLGMQLADAQMRLTFPRVALHPLNPVGTNTARHNAPPMPPFTGARPVALPTAEELILAAINAGRLKDATWRGEAGELDDLFPAPGGTPADGCAAFTDSVSAEMRALDANLTLLAGKSLAKDYFPYGGVLGGGELAMPKIITQGLPKEWGELMALSSGLFAPFTLEKGQTWLAKMGEVMTYLGSTECVGQLGFYLPAPNPVLLPGETQIDWSTMTVDSLMKRLQTDPAALIGRTINTDLYEVDEIVMAGWTDAKLLGVDLTRARLSYADRTLLATASIPANPPTGTDDNWFNDFFNGAAQFRIALPKGQDTGLVNYAATDLFTHIGTQITTMQGLNATAMQTKIQEVQASLIGAMPRVSLELEAGVTIPPLIEDFIAAQGGAGIELFAFSPFFEPDYVPADQSGYAVARRNGGMGLCGNIRLGYFPDGQEVFGVNISQACLTIAAPASATDLPSVIGDFAVPDFTLPGGFTFSGQAHFASSPAVGHDFLNIEGEMSPITLGNFVSITPLALGQTELGGSLRVTRTSAAPAVGMSLRPAKFTMPMLGSAAGKIYGQNLGGGDLTDFSFSSVPGQPWAATVELDGALELRNPLDPASTDVVFRSSAAGGAKFLGSITGNGLDTWTVSLQIPNGQTIELFPGKAHGSKFTIGDNSVSCLFVKSDGTVYYDSGTRTFNLGGFNAAQSFASMTGRVEVGFNPPAPVPVLTFGTTALFSAPLGGVHEQAFSVTASGGTARGSIVVDASTGSNVQWSVEPARLIVPAGQTRSFLVRYHPSLASSSANTLTLTQVPSSGAPIITTRNLNGVPQTGANLHLSSDAVDFGNVQLGRSASEVIRISNIGSASATVSIPAPVAPFSLSSPSAVVIPANSTADLVFTFTPTVAGSADKEVILTTNSPDFPTLPVFLKGNAVSGPAWLRVRSGDGTDPLRAVAVRTGVGGKLQAVGDNGLFLVSGSALQTWERRRSTDGADLRAISFPATVGWAAGTGGIAYKTTNGGSSWGLQTNAGLVDGDWRDLHRISSATDFFAFAGTAKDKTDGRIVRQTAATTFSIATIPAGTPALNGIAFSSTTNGIAVGEAGAILRTTNGGANWSQISLPAGAPAGIRLRDVSALTSTVLVIVGDAGTVLRSADSGATWSVLSGIPSQENLNGVSSFAGSFMVAAGDRGTILTSTNGSTWTREASGTVENLTGAAAALASAVVSEAGDILLRAVNASAAPFAGIQTNLNGAEFDNLVKDGGYYGEILVSNGGGAAMTASIASSSAAYTVLPTGTQTVPAGGSVRFLVKHVGTGSDENTTLTVTTSDPQLPSSIINIGGKAGTGVSVAAPALHGPAFVDLGAVAAGSTASATLSLANIGLSNANLSRFSIRSDSTGFQVAEPSKDPFPPGGTSPLEISFSSTLPGRHQAVIEVLSDAWNGILPIEVIATVVPVPEQVLLRSVPAGVTMSVDGIQTTLPAVFSISDTVHNPAAGILQRGNSVTVIAPLSHGSGTSRVAFDRWDEAAGNVLTFTAGQTARELVATYDRELPAGPAVAAAPVVPPSCSFQVPTDAPAGPWVKVSQATLTLPWLGGTGTPFSVEGAAFFSLTRGDASLKSSGVLVRVPNVPATFGQLANREMLEITPGSWSMAYVNNNTAGEGSFQVRTGNPGLQIFNESMLPPSTFSLTVQSNLTGPLGNAAVAFTTRDDLPLVPQHLAIGASSFSGELGLTGSQPAISLQASSTLRAISNGSGGYHINQAFGFTFNPTLPAITPLTIGANTQIANLGFVRIFSGPTGAQIGPAVTPTGFAFTASNFGLRFFNSPDQISISMLADGSGISMDGALPVAGVRPFATAGMRFVPDTDTQISALFNPLQARVAAHWPAVFVNPVNTSGNIRWESNKVRLPAMDFDTANFAVRIPLPGFDFGNGFPMTERSTVSPDNYAELAFSTGAATLRVRERNDFFLGALRNDFEISSAGALSGVLHGRLGLAGPAPLENANEQISFTYSSTANPSFVANRSLLLVGARFKLGRTGVFPTGQACVLTPSATLPIQSWGEAVCLPP